MIVLQPLAQAIFHRHSCNINKGAKKGVTLTHVEDTFQC